MISNLYVSLILVQSVLFVVLIGILIGGLLEKRRQNKPDVVWSLVLVILWGVFTIANTYSILNEEISLILGLIISISFIIMFVGLLMIVVLRYEFFNKFLTFSEMGILFVLFIMVVAGWYYPELPMRWPILIFSILSALVGYFMIIMFVINGSRKINYARAR